MMKEDIKNSEIIQALVKAQQEITAPIKDKVNPMFKSGYASLDSIYAAVRVPLAKNGLTLSHSVYMETDASRWMKTTLRHISGEELSTSLPMYVDKTTSQGFGSALTYTRRYSICSLLGLPTEEDDDGNEAEKHPPKNREQVAKVFEEPITQEQIKWAEQFVLDNHIESSIWLEICDKWSVKKFEHIRRANFKDVVTFIKSKVNHV